MRYVDPHRRQGLLRRLWVRLLGLQPVGRFSRLVVWRLDPPLMTLTGGRLRMGIGLPTALLETRGARTGQPRRNAVVYFHDGERPVIVASKIGLPTHPAWFHNLVADPEVTLGGEPFRAQVVEDESERMRLWALADRVFPAFARYRVRAARAGRTIQIVRLEPR